MAIRAKLVKGLPDSSIGFTVYSPPFALPIHLFQLRTRYGAIVPPTKNFFTHYTFLLREIFRVTKPGRLTSVHCMNLPTTIQHHGEIGIQDFRGDIIRAHQAAGWIYHSEVCIWKDPVTAMQRTKALGLLHKQIMKDSCMSRQGIPDYVCTFRKPGKNAEPVSGEFEEFIGDGEMFRQTGNLSIDIWQRYASPIWSDIRMNRTLQGYQQAREDADERHVCPLQLDVIERCLELWSKDGDVVLTPFLGIGSEIFCAVKMGRKGIGFELKPSYFRMAVKNLSVAVQE